ncbi:Guanine deaminase [Halomonadaceae bacterium LMG 33818]|uniref:guanine deaminase n=1 Tax=Cernens ardua TaxID=3402176 RepID=UPI003EDB7674
MSLKAIRGPVLHFTRDPGDDARPLEGSVAYLEDGIILIRDGHIDTIAPAEALQATLPADITVDHYPEKLIMPGLIDAHVHFVQLGIIASYGRQLLDWLNNYTFPEEVRFSDKAYAEQVADLFIQQLLRHGTTTAMVFSSSHAHSVDALFSAALERNMRLMTGKMLMDRNAPPALLDDAITGIQESRKLLERWHHKGRLEYVLSPRFAPTSTPEQLSAAGQFLKEYPGIAMQTHLSENLNEIEWVKALYPEADDYLDVYARAGLLQERCFFGHAIHIDDSVRQRIKTAGAGITVCPTSNLFLGSGLFDWKAAREQQVKIALGSDIGAGTSLSQLQTLQDTYKVCQLQDVSLSPWQAFYQLTLGSAQSLGISHQVGNFEKGKEADIVVFDPQATPLAATKRQLRSATLDEQIFDLMMLGDDRSVIATYVMGERQYAAASSSD